LPQKRWSDLARRVTLLSVTLCPEENMINVGYPQWFAVIVKPRFEHAVSQLLAQKGYEQFLPLVPKLREWSDRKKIVHFPLFPRYVFCRFRFDQRAKILSTPGVSRIVSFGSQPCPIPDEEIESLRRAASAPTPLIPCKYLPTGQRVRIRSGPLEGAVGVFVQSKAGSRIIISVHLLQRSAYVEIDSNRVEPIAAPPVFCSATTEMRLDAP
jgi:transcriptional antiterminator NusG